jgi:hypothetical protein
MKISEADYMTQARNFNPVDFDARGIARLAKESGMKWIIITSKYHEGFAMFKSAHPFNIQAPQSTALSASLAAKVNSYAKQSGLVQRVTKIFSREAFLLSQLGAVSTGRASHNQVVASIGHDEAALKISPQALQQRITRTECGVEGFLGRCLSHICQ